MKPSEALRFLGAVVVAVLLLGLLVLRVTACAPTQPPKQLPPIAALPPAPKAAEDCQAPGWGGAAQANAASLRTLAWAPFRRPETGWETYAPLIARETGTSCAPDTPGFAAAYAQWQARQKLPADGLVKETDVQRLKGVWQGRRPFVMVSVQGICPAPPAEATLEATQPEEGYGGKQVLLRPAALAAYRRMAAAARAEIPKIRADPRNLTLFSGYRSPAADAQRCAEDGDCHGVTRATCSPHRSGLAIDLYVGQAPGYGPDSSADPNRLTMSKTAAYRWMLANAGRFGFVNYPFEPWHWEWTGEAP